MKRLKNIFTEKKESDPSIYIVMLGLWARLSRRRRSQLGGLLLIMLISGIAELVSLGLVLPFLLVLSEPERLWDQPITRAVSTQLGFSQASQLLLPATLAFGAAVLLAAIIRIANLWVNGRFAACVGTDLSCEAYGRTLYQPYQAHLKRSSSTVISGITVQINKTVNSVNSFLQLITSAVVAVALLVGLLIIDAQVAIASAMLFGSVYLVLVLTARRELLANGKKIVVASTLQLKALQEGLGAIRDVVLDGSQQAYLKIYSQADRPQRILSAKNGFIGSYPRYALESLGMVAISLVGYLLVFQRGSGAGVIPLLGSFALGAQRLLPAFQQIYIGWATLNYQKSAMIQVLEMINLPIPPLMSGIEQMPFLDSICFDNVSFGYVDDQPNIICGLNLKIYKGESIGIIGSTGSGKSTLLDLLMGLLVPTSGRLMVDGNNLYDPMYPSRLASWRSTIAHVPQTIFLADTSIAENIAFGVPKEQIDRDRLVLAAKYAQISAFVESSSEGYDTFVGERGMMLSGGQRQRIGIARALYKQANVLIFDEATSALDNKTEADLMEVIQNLNENLTLIMIAHRLSTVKNCSRIFEVKHGKCWEKDVKSLI